MLSCAGPALLLLPFVLWDAVLFILRRRGDPSATRRTLLLRHFCEADLEIGRKHILHHLQLYPFSRVLHYLGFILVLFAGLGGSLEAAVLDMSGDRWLAALPLFVGILLAASELASLPLAAYREFVVERKAGLSTTTIGLWLRDRALAFLISCVLAAGLGAAVLGLIKALPTSWPLPAAATILGLMAFITWVSPWVIAPLFNRFTPLADEDLAARVQALVKRAGLPLKEVLVMDASRRGTALNAYFTGLGNSRRVVLFDTLVASCPPGEVLSVVAHELGHWKGRHILKGFLLAALTLGAALLLVQQLLGRPEWLAFFGVPARDSLVLLVLLPFLGSLAGRLWSPVPAALSRRFERYADQVALELAADPASFVALEIRLARRAKADLLVHPFVHALTASHPLPEERIAAALAFSEGKGPPRATADP